MELATGRPMQMGRKESKGHDMKKLIEGVHVPGQVVLVVEDLVTSEMSVMETVAPLRELALNVHHVIVVLGRLKGVMRNRSPHGMAVHCLFSINDMLAVLLDKVPIEMATRDSVLEFVGANQVHHAQKANDDGVVNGTDGENNAEGNAEQNENEQDAAKPTTDPNVSSTSEVIKDQDEINQPAEPDTHPTYVDRKAEEKHAGAKRLL